MSILGDVKIDIGDSEDNHDFDEIIIRHINTAFSILSQLGIGPEKSFKIYGDEEDWDDFPLSNEDYDYTISMVKTYISKKVQIMFDPPQNSTYSAVLTDVAKELEWRLNVAVDPGREET